MTFASKFFGDDEGVDLIEYAFLVGLLAFGCVMGMNQLTGSFTGFFGRIGTMLDGMLP